jgi:hypothetical protein
MATRPRELRVTLSDAALPFVRTYTGVFEK